MVVMLKIGLPNTHCAKVEKTACYVINRFPSITIEMNTPMKMWSSKQADHSSLHISRCPNYVIYNVQERTKLNPKAKKCIFLGNGGVK